MDWINFATEQPTNDDNILVCGDHYHIEFGRYDAPRKVVVLNGRKDEFMFERYKVIHWLKPEFPKY